MKTAAKQAIQLLKSNFWHVLLVIVSYRLLIGSLYIKLIIHGMRFALKMADYSYLTMGNIGPFCLKPWTIAVTLGLLAIGLIIILLEISFLVTAYQGGAYYRRISWLEVVHGGLVNLWDQTRRRNWKLFLLAMIHYALINAYLLMRFLSHVKPLNFVMATAMEEPFARFLVVAGAVICILIAIPTMFVFHGCMVEQKSFRGSLIRSCQLLKGHWKNAAVLVTSYNILMAICLVVVYLICVAVTAVVVVAFTDKNLALAVVLSATDRIELVLLFCTGIFVTLINFAALTVLYYQYDNLLQQEPQWNFSMPGSKPLSARKAYIYGGIMAVTALVLIFDSVRNGVSLAGDVLSEIQITAHRGSSKTAPENTMEALEAAVEELADYAEIDVQLTSDGMVILCHDGNLRRIASVNKTVASLTLEQIRQLDAGSWFSKEYAGVRIPTLGEVLEYCKGRIKLNIELKNLGRDSLLPEKTMALIEEYGVEEQCVITSTNLLYLKRIKHMNPDIKTGYILSAAYGAFYQDESVDFFSIRSSFVNETVVAGAHASGKAIHAWTVNSKNEMERMKMLGVDNLITDRPVLAREILYREEATETLIEYIKMVLQ